VCDHVTSGMSRLTLVRAVKCQIEEQYLVFTVRLIGVKPKISPQIFNITVVNFIFLISIRSLIMA
jgi:hypothetical protein